MEIVTMSSFNEWRKDRRSIFISADLHNKITKIQSLYKQERKYSVPIGYILEQLLAQDSYIISLLARINKEN